MLWLGDRTLFQNTQQALSMAQVALEKGNLAISEAICREILDRDSRNIAALNILGLIAIRIGRNADAVTLFKASRRAEPNEIAEHYLNSLKAQQKRQIVARDKRYLVIKSWGFGFWSDVSQVLGGLLLAEITQREPVVHWGANSLYRDEGIPEAFARFFEPVSSTTIDSLVGMEADFFPAKWKGQDLKREDFNKWRGEGSRVAPLYFLGRHEKIAVLDFYAGIVELLPWIPREHPMHGKSIDRIYRYLAAKYLRVRPSIVKQVDDFFSLHLEGSPFVAVHLRGSDKFSEQSDIQEVNATILTSLSSIDPSWRIFLLTDDLVLAARVRQQLGDRVVMTGAQRTNLQIGIHHQTGALKEQLGKEILMDTLLALRAERFIGNGASNVAAIISLLKEWKPGACTLVRPSMLHQRNLFIHSQPASG